MSSTSTTNVVRTREVARVRMAIFLPAATFQAARALDSGSPIDFETLSFPMSRPADSIAVKQVEPLRAAQFRPSAQQRKRRITDGVICHRQQDTSASLPKRLEFNFGGIPILARRAAKSIDIFPDSFREVLYLTCVQS
jgi:hypothetical protein